MYKYNVPTINVSNLLKSFIWKSWTGFKKDVIRAGFCI